MLRHCNQDRRNGSDARDLETLDIIQEFEKLKLLADEGWRATFWTVKNEEGLSVLVRWKKCIRQSHCCFFPYAGQAREKKECVETDSVIHGQNAQ